MFNPDRFFLFILVLYIADGVETAVRYIIGVLITLALVLLIKKLTDRDRPDGKHILALLQLYHHNETLKTGRLREKE
jgi:SNF family Na+-dependent transporter